MRTTRLSNLFDLYRSDQQGENALLRIFSPWFRHDHLVYILDSFDTLDELNEFSSLLDKISHLALQGQTDIRPIFATIPGHTRLIAKVSKANSFV